VVEKSKGYISIPTSFIITPYIPFFMYAILSVGSVPIIPFNYGGGCEYEIYSRLNALSMFRKVIYIYPDKTERRAKINENFYMEGVARNRIVTVLSKSVIGFFRMLGTNPNIPLSKEAWLFVHKKYRKKVVDIATKENCVLIFEFPGGILSLLEEVGNHIKILRAHDVEMEFSKTKYSTGNPLREKITDWFLKKLEGEFAMKCDLIFTITPEDGEKLHTLYGIPKEKMIWIPPLFSTKDITILSPNEKKKAKSKKGLEKKICVLLMSAARLNLRHKGYENIKFVNTILNDYAKKFLDVDFLVMGGICNVTKNPAKNVKLLGIVDEKTKHEILQIADMAINPVIMGAGINTRMVEYMAYGIPVVTTKIGTRGTFTRDGESAVIRDPENFPDGIEFLLADGERARTIGLNARKIIEEHFSAEVVARRAIEAIDRVWLEKYGK